MMGNFVAMSGIERPYTGSDRWTTSVEESETMIVNVDAVMSKVKVVKNG
jgi:hypothetical protein